MKGAPERSSPFLIALLLILWANLLYTPLAHFFILLLRISPIIGAVIFDVRDYLNLGAAAGLFAAAIIRPTQPGRPAFSFPVILIAATIAITAFSGLVNGLPIGFIGDIATLFQGLFILHAMDRCLAPGDGRRLVRGLALPFTLLMLQNGLELFGMDLIRVEIGTHKLGLRGHLGNPNFNGTFLAMAVAFLAGETAAARTGRARVFLAFLFMTASFFLMKTNSRGAMVAIILGLPGLILAWLVMGGRPRARHATILLALVALGIILALLNPVTLERLGTLGSSRPDEFRLMSWSIAARMIEEKWLLGWGPHGFGLHALEWTTSPPSEMLVPGSIEHSHSELLEILIRSGILGLLPLILLGFLFIRALPRNLSATDSPLRWRFAALAGTLITFLVCASIDVVATVSSITLFPWLAAGLILDPTVLTESKPGTRGKVVPPGPGSPLARVVLLIVLVGIVVLTILALQRCALAKAAISGSPLVNPRHAEEQLGEEIFTFDLLLLRCRLARLDLNEGHYRESLARLETIQSYGTIYRHLHTLFALNYYNLADYDRARYHARISRRLNANRPLLDLELQLALEAENLELSTRLLEELVGKYPEEAKYRDLLERARSMAPQ